MNQRKTRAGAWILVRAINAYQRSWSTSFVGTCIYTPTCSVYALRAIQRYGAIRGVVLTMTRLMRCRPPYVGGLDPVP